MDKNVIIKISEYLKKEGLFDLKQDDSNVVLREGGKTFSTEEHLQGMIYSFLSAQTVWANVERHLPEIDKLFFMYDLEKIKCHDYMYFVRGLQNLRCASRLTNAQMKALHENIATIERIVDDFGSMDSFVTSMSLRETMMLLSDPWSKYKIKQMGAALACEYLRNVGIDAAKPDLHIKWMFGRDRLGESSKETASDAEALDTIEKLSKQTGYRMSDIDYMLWGYCATDKGEICTAKPACSRCVIQEYCQKGKRNS